MEQRSVFLPHAIEYRKRVIKRDVCQFCGAVISSEEFHGITNVNIYISGKKSPKKIVSTEIEQTCKTCAIMDFALKEADDLCVRFSLVGVGEIGNQFLDRRCLCGKASYMNKKWPYQGGFCIYCARDIAQLKKDEAEIKIALRMAKNVSQLLKEYQR